MQNLTRLGYDFVKHFGKGMKEDAFKWDKRHSQDLMPETPSDFLVKFAGILPKGKVLDIACGNGRNAKFLAQNGFICECIDISQVALKRLLGLERIIPICSDLDTYEIKPDAYTVILDFYFLDRRLFKGIKKGLKFGGVFLMETFVADKNFPTDICTDKILQPAELEKEFCDFEIFFKQECIVYRLDREIKTIAFGARKIK
ncbi:class I SAM-dependent methyltransferase [Helicobacter sp. 12S02232-10]|uniref:class I SAM-dependent methyltransferase n=1 Tax=Helicobacter sp. 12S02232-10 TaxID=1476197 RepID=UPI000BA4F730|nr:class I SAM-dependent methyltransferase [Helicobacter sp. 12S02232-10]